MTLQIVMPAQDGWLIASDMSRNLALRTRTGSLTSKIVCSQTLRIAYAFAGDDCAIVTGQILERQFSELDLQDAESMRATLKQFGDAAWQQSKRGNPIPPNAMRARSLLIGFAESRYPLWELRIGEESIAYNVVDKASISGDDTSPTLFFTERYYQSNLPVENLMLLAAHVILLGAEFADYVRELEMVVCKDGTLTKYSSGCDKLRQLTEQSREADKAIARMLGVPEPIWPRRNA